MKKSYLVFFLVLLALAVVGLVSAQDAQPPAGPSITTPDGTSIPLNPVQWFSVPGLLVLVIGGAVAWLRKLPGAAERLDGPVVVPVVAIATGAALGALGQLVGWLTITPFSDMTSPLGGILYGGLSGAEAVLGVSLIRALFPNGKKATTGGGGARAAGNPLSGPGRGKL